MDSKIQTTKDIIKKRKKINEFIIKIKHTVIKIGFRELVWLWRISIEPKHRQILFQI